jgi:hypothetical protein
VVNPQLYILYIYLRYLGASSKQNNSLLYKFIFRSETWSIWWEMEETSKTGPVLMKWPSGEWIPVEGETKKPRAKRSTKHPNWR